MPGKTQFTYQLNWVDVSPAPFRANTAASGVTSGAMSGTSTVYSQIVDVHTIDNCGLELTWTGTPTGNIQILASSSGTSFYPISFSPSLEQPAGSAGGYLINLNQFPWQYIMVEYTNTSGSGSLTAYLTAKGLQ